MVWQLFVKRGVASATLAIANQVPWMGLKSLFEAVGRHPRPVLLVWGEKDKLNPVVPAARQVQQCFGNARLLVVKGAGHIAICDRPRQVVLAILDFLQQPETHRSDDY